MTDTIFQIKGYKSHPVFWKSLSTLSFPSDLNFYILFVFPSRKHLKYFAFCFVCLAPGGSRSNVSCASTKHSEPAAFSVSATGNHTVKSNIRYISPVLAPYVSFYFYTCVLLVSTLLMFFFLLFLNEKKYVKIILLLFYDSNIISIDRKWKISLWWKLSPTFFLILYLNVYMIV